MSCNFGVLAGEDDYTSFYSAIVLRFTSLLLVAGKLEFAAQVGLSPGFVSLAGPGGALRGAPG